MRAFPKGDFRIVHSIDATLPFGNNTVLLGVIAVEKAGLHMVLLSPEGLSLFEADYSGDKLEVQRALPPLNRGGFAQGLLDDVRATFLPPPGTRSIVGRSPDGQTVCRFDGSGDLTTDVVLGAHGPAIVRNYRGTSSIREIQITGVDAEGFHSEIKLRVPGIGGYSLTMRLLSREGGAEGAATPISSDVAL
jgi:hypothetical protein